MSNTTNVENDGLLSPETQVGRYNMYKRSVIVKGFVITVLTMFLFGCAAMAPKPTEKNFQDPVVTLDYVEVAHYWGWWYFSNKVKPTMGTAGNYGAPLDLAFVFDEIGRASCRERV